MSRLGLGDIFPNLSDPTLAERDPLEGIIPDVTAPVSEATGLQEPVAAPQEAEVTMEDIFGRTEGEVAGELLAARRLPYPMEEGVVQSEQNYRREALLKEKGYLRDHADPERDTPWFFDEKGEPTTVDNLFRNISEFIDGVTFLAGQTLYRGLETVKEAGDLIADVAPMSDGMRRAMKDFFAEDEEFTGAVQFLSDLYRGDFEKVEKAATYGKQIGVAIIDEFKELIPQWAGGKVGTIEAIQRNPLNQVLNILTIASLGGTSMVKGGQAIAKAGGTLAKTGEFAQKVGTAIKPISYPSHILNGEIKLAERWAKTPQIARRVSGWVTRLQGARLQAYYLNQIPKYRKTIKTEGFQKVEDALRSLTPEDFHDFHEVVEGTRAIGPNRTGVLKTLEALDELSDMELRMMGFKKTKDEVVEQLIKKHEKDANWIAKHAKMSDDAKSVVDNILESMMGRKAFRVIDEKATLKHLKGMEFDMASELSKALKASTPRGMKLEFSRKALIENAEFKGWVDYAKEKWHKMEFENVQADIAKVTFKEDRVYRPMAIADGMMKSDDFNEGRKLTVQQVNTLRKKYQTLFPERTDPVYFPHQFDRNAIRVGVKNFENTPDGRKAAKAYREEQIKLATTKGIEITDPTTGEKVLRKMSKTEAKKRYKIRKPTDGANEIVSNIFRPGTPGYMRRFTAVDDAFIRDVEEAYKRRVWESANREAQIKAANNLLENLVDRGIAKPMIAGVDKMDGHVIIDTSNYTRFHMTSMGLEDEFFNSMKAFNNNIDEAMNAVENRAGEIAQQMGTVSTGPAFFVPKEYATSIRKHLKWQNNKSNQMAVVYDSATAYWRNAVLGLSPRWHINGAIGNLILNTIGGVGPFAYARVLPALMRDMAGSFGFKADWLNKWAGGIMKKAEKVDDIIPEEALGGLATGERQLFNDALPGEISKKGGAINKFRMNIGDKPIGKVAAHPIEFSFNMMSNIDNFFRRAHYVDKGMAMVRKRIMKNAATKFEKTYNDATFGKIGGGLDQMRKMTDSEIASSVKSVNEFLFNYENLTVFEQKFMRRIIPFYSWFRNINQFVFALPVKYPGRAWALAKISKIGQDHLNRDDVPEWLRGAVRVGMDENGNALFLNTSGINPFFGLDEVHIGLNPMLKIAIERAMGVDLFKQRPFQAPGAFGGRTRTIDPVTGETREETVLPPLFEHLLRQIPQYGVVEDMFVGANAYDTSTLLNPKVKVWDDKVKMLEKRFSDLLGRSVPKDFAARQRRYQEIQRAKIQLYRARRKKANTAVKVTNLFFETEEMAAKYPRDWKLSLLRLVGVNLTPVDVEETREGKVRLKHDAINDMFKRAMAESKDFRQFAEGVLKTVETFEEYEKETARRRAQFRRLTR